jgi:hypothetical protein
MVQFVDEKHNQVSAGLGLAQSGVDMLAATMPILHGSQQRLALDDLMNFLAGHPMLGFNLLDDRIQPIVPVIFLGLIVSQP